MMSDVEDRGAEAAGDPDEASAAGRADRAREKLTAAMASAKSASEKHVALAVPLRAAERNRRVAASVLAGGLAYRLFLWLLPFGLIVGGALGLSNANSTEDAVEGGGLPAAVSNAVGDAARSADSSSWWLFAVGFPLLVWAGFSGAKAVQLVHSLVWDEPPTKTKPLKGSLVFTGMLCATIATIAATSWFRDVTWHGLLAGALTIAPLTGLWLWVSLHLPHRDAPWRALLPGAFLVGIGVPVLSGLVDTFLVPKLEKSESLYGGLGATTTVIFFIYLLATLVVTAPILNSSLHQELSREQADG
jgi:membrane protein